MSEGAGLYYILEGKTPKKIDDLFSWGRWMEKSKHRKIARDDVGEVVVSTVFLGVDHSFLGGGAPLLFETMIFGGEHDEYQKRYSTWDQAQAGHKKALSLVNGEENDD